MRRNSTPRRSARRAANTRWRRSTCSARISCVSASWATGHTPYLTLAPRYEAEQLRAFAQIIRNGHLYKGYKPVHWCMDCRSALAEAEVEYEERTSPSIDVRFEVVDRADLARRLGVAALPPGRASIAIWTTTPWTLPANQAVAVTPGVRIFAVRSSRADSTARRAGRCRGRARRPAFDAPELLILASELADSVLQRASIPSSRELARVKGAALEGLQLQHPFYDRVVPVILGEHVTLESGTGAVHTAPGHGQEDYIVGKQYGLPVDNPVGGDGRFLPATPNCSPASKCSRRTSTWSRCSKSAAGWCITKPLPHSYPHCWRHKTPIIFRATPQWFIGMEQAGSARQRRWPRSARSTGCRAGASSASRAWSTNRPDWCISRQRTWGVPIALFHAQGNRRAASAHRRV